MVKPRNISSHLLRTILCGTVCNRELKNLNVILKTLSTEKINTNKNIVLTSTITLLFYVQTRYLFLTRPNVFSTFERFV